MIEAFLDAVCAEIRWKRWRDPVRAELYAHLADRIEYLTVQRGFSPEEAEYEAVLAMGDPKEIGQALDREHRASRFYGYSIAFLLFSIIILYIVYYFA